MVVWNLMEKMSGRNMNYMMVVQSPEENSGYSLREESDNCSHRAGKMNGFSAMEGCIVY